MRYVDAVQPLETGGMQETAQFTIAATGKAFRNLMDGLYSRKIEAFCREILTNAFDSHCEAGTPERKFDVWVPTIFDKRLRVRDYGVGMTHEQVMTRYSTLFDSTKDQSDEFVGMLGLGSKSPFAYTDGFSLRCWDGEECRTYSAYLGPGGVPQISLAARVPSSEPRGVEVGIPVKREDFDEILQCLARVCVGFSHPPTLPPEQERRMVFRSSLSGTGWACGTCDVLGKEVYARQGCVLYPIPRAEVQRHIDGFGRYETNRDMCTIVLDFELGELDVATSRESLSLTEKSREAIGRKIELFLAELGEDFESNFEDCNTGYEYALRWHTLNVDGLPKSLLRNTPQAQKAEQYSSAIGSLMRQRRGSRNPWRWTMISLNTRGSGWKAGSINSLYYNYANAADSYHVPQVSLPDEEKDLAWVVDEESSNARVAHWLSKSGYKKAIVLRKSCTMLKHEPVVVRHPDSTTEKPLPPLVNKQLRNLTEDDLLKLPIVDKIGHPPFRRASHFPKPPKPARIPAPKEDGLELDRERGVLLRVTGERLNELRKTHEFFFYSKQRRAVLRPRADVPASEWAETFKMSDTDHQSMSNILSQMKLLNGHFPKIAFVRVLPSTKYDDVRKYKLASSVEDVLLNNTDEKFWDEVVPSVIWKLTAKGSLASLDEEFLPIMEKSPSANVRRIARLIQHERKHSKTMNNESYYHQRKVSLVQGMIASSDVIMRRFVQEVRKRDYLMPRIRNPESYYYSDENWISHRWTCFFNRITQTQHLFASGEEQITYQKLEELELEIQARGGRVCRGRRRKTRPSLLS